MIMIEQTEYAVQEMIVEESNLQQLFELEKAYILRKKINFSFVFIRYSLKERQSYEQFFKQIDGQLRNSDFAFRHVGEQYVLLLLSISRINEAKSFIQRLGSLPQFGEALSTCIVEVANAKYTLMEILKRGEEVVLSIGDDQQEPAVILDFLEKQVEIVKVSIVENDSSITAIFSNMLAHLAVPNIELDIQTFKDGLDFIESDWYRSGHTHLLLLNDILPRKNGIEVLTYLRSLPNEQKYLILFISTRVSEEAQLYCYENGADAYFVRPFNLRILETRIKNYLRRLS